MSKSNPRLLTKTEFPGPGAYNVQTTYISRQQKFPAYTIANKAKQTCILDGNDPSRPGPGNYKAISMSKDGKYSIGKYVNSKCPVFG